MANATESSWADLLAMTGQFPGSGHQRACLLAAYGQKQMAIDIADWSAYLQHCRMALSRIKKVVRRSPFEGAAVRMMAIRRPELRQQYEWGIRIRRDTDAMRRIIYRELRGSDTAIDVGANMGELTEWFFDTAPGGRHHVIEPLPSLAASLQRRFPEAIVHQCALSDTDGSADFFHVVDDPAWSGFRRQDVVADNQTVTIDVDVRRLDGLVGDTTVKLIKIDVEGAELGVLRGAKGLLNRDRPMILFEHAPIHADAFGTRSDEVWTLLDDAGYLLAPVADESRLLSRDDFRALNEESHRTGYDRHALTNWIARQR